MRAAVIALSILPLAVPAAADPPAKSPACALLTLDEVKALMGHDVMIGDDAAPAAGMASCGWVDAVTYNALSVTVSNKEALGGIEPKAALESMKSSLASDGQTEDIVGAGDAAFLAVPNDKTASLLTVYLAKGGSFATVNATGVGHDQIISAAKTIAGRL